MLHAMHAASGVLAVGACRMLRVVRWRVARRARRGRRAGALAERAARCTRAQGGGGVIRIDKGAALFDGVAISGAEASVRAGGRRWLSGPMRVGGAGAVSDGVGGGCGFGCAQEGGVVLMDDGAVTFKGGTITNATAQVRTGHLVPAFR